MTAQPATIQVQYVNPPKPGKRAGSVRDANGQYWTVAPEHLGFFSPNQMAEILYDDHGNYKMVVGMGGQLFPAQARQPAPGSAVQPAQPQTYGQPRNAAWPAPPTQELTRVPDSQPTTPPILSNILATAVEAGLIKEPGDLVAWAYHVRQAVENYHSSGVIDTHSPAGQARNPAGDNGPGLDDEIPF